MFGQKALGKAVAIFGQRVLGFVGAAFQKYTHNGPKMENGTSHGKKRNRIFLVEKRFLVVKVQKSPAAMFLGCKDEHKHLNNLPKHCIFAKT